MKLLARHLTRSRILHAPAAPPTARWAIGGREHPAAFENIQKKGVPFGGFVVHSRRVGFLLSAFLFALAPTIDAQNAAGAAQGSAPSPPAQPPTFATTVTVIETAPLPGVDLPIEKVPAPAQTATSVEIERSKSLDLSSFLTRRFNAVFANEIQNNPFQPDINYRGYTGSPLLGTPQGLSVYMDGVRLNQPFGDVVSWDLIPRLAISTTTLMPGSNPLFGLNTLGGALALQTKNGATAPGTTVQAVYGSDVRRSIEFEHGGRKANGVNWYVAGNLFKEDGWRDDSPSDVRQIFGKVGWQRATSELFVSAAHADNALNGNGLQEAGFLDRDYASVYTKPDTTENRSTFLNLTGSRSLSAKVLVSGNVYYRRIHTDTFNGDINEESLDQSVYQPSAAERAALAAAGYTGVPASGANASNTRFPSWRCIANVLLQDEPAEKCNGLINRSETSQQSGGGFGQIAARHAFSGGENQFTAGGGYDRSRAGFVQSTELGYLNEDRSVTGLGAFGDAETGGDVDGEPFDTRVDLDGLIRTVSVYATDTVTLSRKWSVTLSGRYNRTTIRNRDAITPGGGPASLDGDHVFGRFNPAAGVTFSPSQALNLYGGYSEGSRAATSIELGCANPDEPCKLPNAMAGDPPLDQVVTRTWEGGARGAYRGIDWSAGVFRADNRDDILFVLSDQTGFGYFKNFGETRRKGLELGAHSRIGRVTIGAGYTFLSATYESEETVNGESNSANDEAEEGEPGLEGSITIEPGNRIPLVPRHMFKAYADIPVGAKLSIDVDLLAVSGSFARGNENNLHEPDGTYYLGPGSVPGYAIVNLGVGYRLAPWVQLVAQVTNLFDRKYYTAGQLGPLGFTETGAFIARPLPAIDGEFPVRQGTFFAPGAPARVWAGTKLTF
ncbi:MAG: TonB-dependent receptor [Acidobacteria bacterium]|nr:TonB-dependent receptor [Acidobacteriota bacterium]